MTPHQREAVQDVEARRYRLRLTQKQLCERVGIFTASYSRAKSHGFGFDLLAKVEKALDELEAERASA